MSMIQPQSTPHAAILSPKLPQAVDVNALLLAPDAAQLMIGMGPHPINCMSIEQESKPKGTEHLAAGFRSPSNDLLHTLQMPTPAETDHSTHLLQTDDVDLVLLALLGALGPQLVVHLPAAHEQALDPLLHWRVRRPAPWADSCSVPYKCSQAWVLKVGGGGWCGTCAGASQISAGRTLCTAVSQEHVICMGFCTTSSCCCEGHSTSAGELGTGCHCDGLWIHTYAEQVCLHEVTANLSK